MKLKSFSVLALSLAAFALPAQAGEIGWSSEGSLKVTVRVEPVGAAMAAAEQGATGLWTLSGRSGGLMVSLPSTVIMGQGSEISLFATQTSNLVVTSNDLMITRSGMTSDRGFQKSRFSAKARHTGIKGRPARVLISTI